MTTPYETVKQLLINISNDRRRTASNYSNITPNPGSSQTPQRLINDIDFYDLPNLIITIVPALILQII